LNYLIEFLQKICLLYIFICVKYYIYNIWIIFRFSLTNILSIPTYRFLRKMVIAHNGIVLIPDDGNTTERVSRYEHRVEVWQRLFQIVRYTGTDIQRTTACTRIICMMTNRASAKREPLIHQHQAGTRASCGPWAFHTVEPPHYIPAVDVARHPQRTSGAPDPATPTKSPS